jgi:hypothetical protein
MTKEILIWETLRFDLYVCNVMGGFSIDSEGYNRGKDMSVRQ